MIIKPGTKYPTIIIIKALIKKVKSPKVIILTGMENKSSMGFKNVFNKPKTMAVIKAVQKLFTATPGKI